MATVNINIDLDSLSQFFAQVVDKLQHLDSLGVMLVILSLVFPPLAVLIKVGLTTHLWVNILLTILGYVPGILHALWVVLFL